MENENLVLTVRIRRYTSTERSNIDPSANRVEVLFDGNDSSRVRELDVRRRGDGERDPGLITQVGEMIYRDRAERGSHGQEEWEIHSVEEGLERAINFLIRQRIIVRQQAKEREARAAKRGKGD